VKAAVLTEFGPPEVLHVREVAAPVAKGSHDLLIRVRATSVNFGDTLVRNFAAVSPRTFHMPWFFWLVGKLYFGFRKPRDELADVLAERRDRRAEAVTS